MITLDNLPGVKPQEVSPNLPKYPAEGGPTLATQIERRHRPELEAAGDRLRAALDAAEEALLKIVDQHEARTERRDRLQAYATKKVRAVPGGVVSVNGAGR